MGGVRRKERKEEYKSQSFTLLGFLTYIIPLHNVSLRLSPLYHLLLPHSLAPPPPPFSTHKCYVSLLIKSVAAPLSHSLFVAPL